MEGGARACRLEMGGVGGKSSLGASNEGVPPMQVAGAGSGLAEAKAPSPAAQTKQTGARPEPSPCPPPGSPAATGWSPQWCMASATGIHVTSTNWKRATRIGTQGTCWRSRIKLLIPNDFKRSYPFRQPVVVVKRKVGSREAERRRDATSQPPLKPAVRGVASLLVPIRGQGAQICPKRLFPLLMRSAQAAETRPDIPSSAFFR